MGCPGFPDSGAVQEQRSNKVKVVSRVKQIGDAIVSEHRSTGWISPPAMSELSMLGVFHGG